MRAVDTNILARWLLGDDAEQTALAIRIVEQTVWISQSVLLELGWVLFKALGLPRDVVAGMLWQVTLLESAQIENGDLLIWAIERFAQGADWADMVHLASCTGNAGQFVTFDRALARNAGERAPVEIETL